MNPHDRDSLHLTYCLNVHAGETWDENLEAIRRFALPIRDQVAPGQPFGLGLRLGHAAAEALALPEAIHAFRRFLSDHALYVFTVNGFPYGAFHGTSVKESVYRPDWRTVERLDYTNRLADILVQLLPDNVEGSISTVPGSYAAWIKTEEDRWQIARNLTECAAHLHGLETRTGRTVHIGLEPEPDCLLETTEQTVAFFTQTLDGPGAEHLAGLIGTSADEARRILRRHVGVCFDTCHLALQFEDLPTSLDALTDAGIRISKLQVSAALRTEYGPATHRALEELGTSIYLHQVKERNTDGCTCSRGDLPFALTDSAGRADGFPPAEWRVHCHVPLFFESHASLFSTADQLTPAFFTRAVHGGVQHIEIETYTLNVLPPAFRGEDIVKTIAREFAWLLPRLPEPGC